MIRLSRRGIEIGRRALPPGPAALVIAALGLGSMWALIYGPTWAAFIAWLIIFLPVAMLLTALAISAFRQVKRK